MSLICYTPEMGEAKPNTEAGARREVNGKHWKVWTTKELTGRGITLEAEVEDGMVPTSTRNGKRRYLMTYKAFDEVCKSMDVAAVVLLN